jgi:hypothetical protein
VLRPARGLLAFAVVVAVATPVEASAACAWVLWQQTTALGPSFQDGWDVVEALPDRPTCDARVDARLLNPGPLAERGNGRTLVLKGRNGVAVLTYLCLPDTIDPRGPKR